MASPLFTKEQAERIRAHHKEHGTPIKEIAQKVDVTPETISDVIRRRGAYTEGRKRPIVIPKNGPEALRLRYSCDPPMPMGQIAERLGINSRQRVHQILKKMDNLIDAGHYTADDMGL